MNKNRASLNILLLNISLFYAFFLIGANYVIAGPVLIELSARAGVATGLMGYFFSSISIGAISGAFITTFLGRFNIRNKLFPLIYLLMPASNLLMAYSKNFISLLISAILTGLSIGLIEANGTVLVAESGRAMKSRLILILQAFFSFGAFAGPMLISLFTKYGIALSMSFTVMAILGFINFILLMFIKIPHNMPKTDSDTGSKQKAGWKNKKAVILIAAIFSALFFYVAFESGINSWIPTFLRLDRNFSVFIAGNAIAFFWLTMAAGRLLVGLISIKIKVTYLLLLLSTLAVISFKLAASFSSNIAIILFLALTGIIIGGIWPLLLSATIYFFPGSSKTILPLLITSGNIGGVISPWLIGLVFNKFSLNKGMELVFIFSIITVIMIILMIFMEKFYKSGRVLQSNKNDSP